MKSQKRTALKPSVAWNVLYAHMHEKNNGGSPFGLLNILRMGYVLTVRRMKGFMGKKLMRHRTKNRDCGYRCHHCDGIQDIYWNDSNILYISIHQDGRTLYSGFGHLDESGGPSAVGKTVNIPLPPETSEEGFLFVLDEIVLPILKDFRPELIINSAGQDNHYTDPITNMNFIASGYAALNDRLNPHIAVL